MKYPVLVSGVALLSLLAASVECVAAEWPEIVLEKRLDGFTSPVQVTHAGDGTGRIFVVEQGGRVWVVRDGMKQATPFLDLSDRVSCCGERGLLSIAFPPGFAVDGWFVADYTDHGSDTVLARYHLTGDPDQADPASEEVLLRISQPFTNHNGGQLAFGPEGYLYMGTGDGGSGGDPGNRAQTTGVLLGKLLRLDVSPENVPYANPPSNPFYGSASARPEIWALGLRNPWRFSFDRATGDLWIGDVGQGSWEEIDRQPAGSAGGENYGWNVLEGSHCYGAASCDGSGFVLPVAEYDHGQGCSVTGGFVVRDPALPRLDGIYLYGDYCSGRLWGLRRAAGGWESSVLAETGLTVSAFGEDERGTVYVADYGGGAVYAVADAAGPTPVVAVVPAVAHLAGAGGTPWRTTVSVVNRSGAPTELTLGFLGDVPLADATVELGPGESQVWRDVLVDALGLDPGASASGVLVLRSTAALAATARTFAEGASGTYGQQLPALGPDDGFGPGDAAVLPLVVRSDTAYSNLGAVNLGSEACRAVIQPRRQDGTAAGGLIALDLAAGEWRQLFDPLADIAPFEGWADVTVSAPECRAWAYASVIDAGTRDPTTVGVVVR